MSELCIIIDLIDHFCVIVWVKMNNSTLYQMEKDFVLNIVSLFHMDFQVHFDFRLKYNRHYSSYDRLERCHQDSICLKKGLMYFERRFFFL